MRIERRGAAAAAAAEAAGPAAMDRESRSTLRPHLAGVVLRGRDLHILTLAPPVLLVFDAHVGELHVAILDRQLVRGSPCRNLFRRSIRAARGVPVPAIVAL